MRPRYAFTLIELPMTVNTQARTIHMPIRRSGHPLAAEPTRHHRFIKFVGILAPTGTPHDRAKSVRNRPSIALTRKPA